MCLVFGGLGGIATAATSLFLKRGARIFSTDLSVRIGVLEVQTVSQSVPAAQQTVSATPQTEAEANIAGKFGEEAKVGYVTCDVSSGVQVESECPFTTFMFSLAKINSKLHQGPCTTDVIGEGGGQK